ncbi:reticulon-2-like isoform X2 [Mobula hypostoma]|uniref:reticulon-2-like isoform X2 n=1 Tax=Mobula hypostoma TaxID=723540 RepID=UPI002FC39EA7
MGQVLGFGHCKESASTVSTTPDSTPSSTEGASEDFLEPQTAQDLSDDDVSTDTSLHWGTPRQMSLDSALSCRASLIQAGCFPSSSLSDLTERGFGDGRSGCTFLAADTPHTTNKQHSASRGIVRTETIEAFLVEDKDDMEKDHIDLSGVLEQKERESVPELKAGAERTKPKPRDAENWDPLLCSPVPSASGAFLLSQDHKETEVPRLGLDETVTQTPVNPIGASNDQKDLERPDMETEMEGGLNLESTISNKEKVKFTEVLEVMSLAAELQLLREMEEEQLSSDPSLPSVSEGEEVPMPDHGEPGVLQTVGLVDTLMPTGGTGIVDNAKPGASDINTNSSDTIVWQSPVIQVSVGQGAQEVMDDEAQLDNRQLSALDQTDLCKAKVFKDADQLEAEGVEVPMPDHGEPGVLQTVGLVDTLMPTGGAGIVDNAKPGVSDINTNSSDTIVWQSPVIQVSVGQGAQEVMDDEAQLDNRQLSALDQTVLCKAKVFKDADQLVIDLLYWEDVKKTGTLFGAIILTLFSLTQFSSISVLAYLALSVLSVTICLRLYTSVLHLIYKTQEIHPFQSYLDLDISFTQEQLRKSSETLVSYLTSTVNHLRRLILVEDLLDSLKFGVLLWLLTYIGALFNGLTLTILVVVGAFIVPLVYRKHKVQINQYLGLLRGQIKDVTAKIQSKLPGSKPKAE